MKIMGLVVKWPAALSEPSTKQLLYSVRFLGQQSQHSSVVDESSNMGKELIELATAGDVEKLRELCEDPESVYHTDPASALNDRDKDGKSSLDMAAMLGRTEVVLELLERGAEVNSQTKKGYTALHRAASWGHVTCLKVLVDSGADLQLRNVHGERAREAAARYSKISSVEYLDIAEAQIALQKLITSTKETIADPEKHMGRFNKEDRLSGNRFCDERIEWLESHKDNTSLAEVLKQTEELTELLRPILSKLEEHGVSIRRPSLQASQGAPGRARFANRHNSLISLQEPEAKK